ncbi:unnamed protein product [Dovyalis caffra]|uniref:Uncharacterized protein n=1 Tax=Dovyalis caffra TaxID=77055 RepID=A0AAV1RSI6_9ROSI|nr:unnamed protein product [Dovyalis caffra]
MEVSVISTEMIKPSPSLAIPHLKPFKISLLDQFIPTFYSPFILFYPIKNGARDHYFKKNAQISTHLKTSLSETLSSFYPFSGRINDNLFIDKYEEGVPFVETRVKSDLFDFLKDPQLELLNQFLPSSSCQPYCLHYQTNTPLLAIQLNMFDCGGIALGFSCSHKIIDGRTASAFLNSWSWAANPTGSKKSSIVPDKLMEASSRFPPLGQPLSQIVSPLAGKLLFDDGNYITRRFVFDAKAITTLRAEAKGDGIENPSRIEALSCFIWKSCTTAARLRSASCIWPSSSSSIAAHAVNIRQRTKPRFSKYSTGNLWWAATAAYEMADDDHMGLGDLVALTREAYSNINADYLNAFQLGGDESGVEAAAAISNIFVRNPKLVLELMPMMKPQVFWFTSWLKFGFHEVDFGWGKPIWVGVCGKVGPRFGNLTILKEINHERNGGIEAWVNLDENLMAIVENDPQFLTFATPNPSILMP